MADVTLWGASYSDVPAILLPKYPSGTARFDDCSVVTATAEDVADGKTFVASDGTITVGTSTGGGSVTQDAQGYIVLPSQGGGSSSGLSIATLTFTVNEYIPGTSDPIGTNLNGPFINEAVGYAGLTVVYNVAGDVLDYAGTPSGVYEAVLYEGAAVLFIDWPPETVDITCSGDIEALEPTQYSFGQEFLLTGDASLSLILNGYSD